MYALTMYPICTTFQKNQMEVHQLGLTTTQAITLFYKQVELKKGLPFDIAIPNEITRQTFNDTDDGRNLIICDNTDDMFKKLGI